MTDDCCDPEGAQATPTPPDIEEELDCLIEEHTRIYQLVVKRYAEVFELKDEDLRAELLKVQGTSAIEILVNRIADKAKRLYAKCDVCGEEADLEVETGPCEVESYCPLHHPEEYK